jgi:hypothetical protein
VTVIKPVAWYTGDASTQWASRPSDLPSVALAEFLCRAFDRFDPT